MLELNKLYNMDCMEGMKLIDNKSIDMILSDLPYGQTKNKWDSIIPFNDLWVQYDRIIKDNGAVVLFGQGMFTAELMQSNKKMWRYNLIWKKGNRATGFLNSKKMPLRNHEDIMVFYKVLPIYNPQFEKGKPTNKRGKPEKETNRNYGEYKTIERRYYGENKFPKSIIEFDREHPPIHPTQKPVKLCEWLIKTYTNENEIVLDNCIGSGTTAIACVNTKRNFIGFELDKDCFNKAIVRLEDEKAQVNLFRDGGE